MMEVLALKIVSASPRKKMVPKIPRLDVNLICQEEKEGMGETIH